MNLPFPLRLPVVAAPMFLISGPDLVLAACKAGIVGAFPTPNARPIAQLDDWMRTITEGLAQARDSPDASTLGPWCANLVTHSSNTRLSEDLELIAKYKPPVVVTALGSPKPAIEVVHGYGGIVLADVINLTRALTAWPACVRAPVATPGFCRPLPLSARCAIFSTDWWWWAAASAMAGAWPGPLPAARTWSTWARASLPSKKAWHPRPTNRWWSTAQSMTCW